MTGRNDEKKRRRDVEALARLLIYGREEAERLGLHLAAHHIDLALDDVETVEDGPTIAPEIQCRKTGA